MRHLLLLPCLSLATGCPAVPEAPDTDADEALDIAGDFNFVYNCAPADACVDDDRTGTLTISTAGDAYLVTWDDGTTADATLAGMVLSWGPADGGTYVENGTYTFSDADNFTKASTYTNDDATTGSCVGIGVRDDGTAPTDAPAAGTCS